MHRLAIIWILAVELVIRHRDCVEALRILVILYSKIIDYSHGSAEAVGRRTHLPIPFVLAVRTEGRLQQTIVNGAKKRPIEHTLLLLRLADLAASNSRHLL